MYGWVCPSDRETRENGKKDDMGGRGDRTGREMIKRLLGVVILNIMSNREGGISTESDRVRVMTIHAEMCGK